MTQTLWLPRAPYRVVRRSRTAPDDPIVCRAPCSQLVVRNFLENERERVDRREVLFSEHYAAAQSLKTAWTRLASTYGCMWVVLSRTTLTIKPHWFAWWLISPLRLDLCHEIPVTDIRKVRDAGRWFSRGKVEVHFRTVEGTDRKVLVGPENPESRHRVGLTRPRPTRTRHDHRPPPIDTRT